MKAFLEYIPLIAFFIVYKTIDIYWAAGALVIGMCLTMAVTVAILKEPVKKSSILLFIFALSMAGLTIAFHDEQFLKWKFSVIYCFFGLALLLSRYVVKVNLFKKSMGNNFTLPEFIWDRINVVWSLFFFFCSGLNIYIFDHWSLDDWVNFKVFGVIGMMLTLVVATVFYIYPYLPDEDKEEKE